MGSLTLTLNLQPLEQHAARALKAAASDLDAELKRQFTEAHWGWPGTTVRQDGSVASSVRDIFDTGALARSQKLVRVSDSHYRVTWDAPYAAAVFLGAVFKTRSSSLPARNVAFGAFQRLNLAESFTRHWKAP